MIDTIRRNLDELAAALGDAGDTAAGAAGGAALAGAAPGGTAAAATVPGDGQQAGDPVRRRLLEAIVAGPQSRPALVTALASMAGWPLPRRVAAAVLFAPYLAGAGRPVLPADVLADWERAQPWLLVPDPDGPGRAAAVGRALAGCGAAIGPAVPLARAAWSLSCAQRAAHLVRRGIIAIGSAPVRCDDHLPALLLLADEELARTLCTLRLGPLLRLRPGQRDRLAATMLAWLQLGENATEVARRVHVHPQTVRYRLRQLRLLFGDQLRDPRVRHELELALSAHVLLANSRTAPDG